MKNKYLLSILASYYFCTASLGFASIDWEQIADDDGVRVYRMEKPDSPIVAFKGEGDIDAPIEKVASIVFDNKRATDWVVDLEETKILRWISKNEFIQYDHIKTPPLVVEDRDFISNVKVTMNKETREVTFQFKSTEEPGFEKSKYIRGELLNTVFLLKPVAGNNNKTQFVGEIHCDPKGSIPKWLVNWFQKNWPMNTIKNLRKQVAKTDIAIDPRFSELAQEGKTVERKPISPPFTANVKK